MRIVINGFGRIGRTVFRQLVTREAHQDIEIVAINDIAPVETCTYLLKYDSVYGPFPQDVAVTEGALVVGSQHIPFLTVPDLAEIDLTGVDVVLECTGRNDSRASVEAGLRAGAKAVLISGPSSVAESTIVLGANGEHLGGQKTVSNASCTTNAIAPLLARLDAELGIQRAHVTTVHCYTGSQPTVDMPGPSLARSRAAATSIIPTTTSAAPQILEVLPEFAGRLTVAAVRVPTLSVSAIDAVIQFRDMPDKPFNEFLRTTFDESDVIGLTNDPVVSTDMRGRPESLILALPETQVSADGQVRVFGWYDNEWGFSARMIDMARRIAIQKG